MDRDRGGWLSDIPEWLSPLILTAVISLCIVEWEAVIARIW